MMNTLILRFTDLPAPALEWLRLDEDVAQRSGAGSLELLADLEPAERIIVLFPAARTLFSEAEIPSKNAQQIQQAARSLIEETLIDDIEDMHIVTQRGDGKLVGIAAVSKTYLRELLALLQQHGLSPQFALPDCLVLPLTDNGWSILESKDGLLIRCGLFSGIQIDNSWLANATPAAIQSLAKRSPERLSPESLSIYHSQPDPDNNGDTQAVDYSAWFSDAEILEANLEAPHSLISFCAHPAMISQSVNFLAAEFTPAQSSRYRWLNWRLPIYSVAAGLLVFTLVLLIQSFSYQNQLQNLQQQTDTLFRQTFPKITTIVDYRLQFERELSKSRTGGTGANVVLRTLYDVLSQLKAADKLTLVQLSYSNSSITLDIQSPDIGTAEHFLSALNKGKVYRVKLLSAQNRDSGTRIRVSVNPVNPS